MRDIVIPCAIACLVPQAVRIIGSGDSPASDVVVPEFRLGVCERRHRISCERVCSSISYMRTECHDHMSMSDDTSAVE